MSKVNNTYSYLNSANYWAPLASTIDDDDTDLVNTLKHATSLTMVLDSGATSSFVMPNKDLPIIGPSNKIVHLPDGSTLQATHSTLLPFKSLSEQARKADVLPGLTPNALVSVGKLADANYTTIFHPHGQGVTVHAKDTYHLKFNTPPAIQGWRDKNGLWKISSGQQIQMKEKEMANNIYDAANNLISACRCWFSIKRYLD